MLFYIFDTIIILVINKRLVKKGDIGLYFLFSNMYYFIYVLIPFLLSRGYISQAKKGSFNRVIEVYLNNQDKVLYANLVVTVGLILILVFAFYSPSYNSALGGVKKGDIYRSSLFSIFVGSIVFSVIVLSVGGISNLLAMSQTLRSGEENISTGFLFHFSKLLLPGSLVLYSSILEGNKKNIFLFSFSLVMSILLLVSLAGRAMIIIFLASFVYVKYIKEGRVYLKYTTFLVIISLLIVFYGDYLFNILSGGVGINAGTKILLEGGAYVLLQDVLREFTFPYTNLLVALEDVSGIHKLYPLEVAKGLFNLLPLGTIGLSNTETISNVNTIKYGTEGQIPIDLLSFGYYSVGVLGVVVFISIICIVYKSFDEQMYLYSNYNHRSLHSIVACKLCFIVMYADMEQFFTGNFYIFMFIFLCFIFKEVRVLGGNKKCN